MPGRAPTAMANPDGQAQRDNVLGSMGRQPGIPAAHLLSVPLIRYPLGIGLLPWTAAFLLFGRAVMEFGVLQAAALGLYAPGPAPSPPSFPAKAPV